MSDWKWVPVCGSKHCDESNGAGTNYWIPVENNHSDSIRRRNTYQLNNIISLSNTLTVLDNLYESPDKATTNIPKVHKALRAQRNRPETPKKHSFLLVGDSQKKRRRWKTGHQTNIFLPHYRLW